MTSHLLHAALRILIPFQSIFGALILLRGHDEPGGGFIAGLVFASAFTLDVIVYGSRHGRRHLPVPPLTLAAAGLLLAGLSSFPGWRHMGVIFTGVWRGSFPFPGVGWVKLGTPLLFDVGVALVVAGVTTQILSQALAGDDEEG